MAGSIHPKVKSIGRCEFLRRVRSLAEQADDKVSADLSNTA